MIRVSDYIMDFLTKKEVEHVFVLAGGGAMFLNDGLARCKKIKYTAVHHEQSATMAAEAYARYNQELGVAMVTCGPGATNAITGVLGAWVDSTPVLILSGQCKTSQTISARSLEGLRQLGAQEADIIPMIKHITKLAVQIREANQIKYYLEKACHMAMEGRPGPVWLDIPLDIQGALVDEEELVGYENKELPLIKTDEISKIYNLILSSQRPVIIVGNGMRKQSHRFILKQLIRQLDIPVVTTRLGCDVIEDDDEHFIGRVGIRGNRSGNFTMQNADLIIAMGTRLSIPVTGYDYEYFARDAKIVMVDLDENELMKKTIRIDYPIKCDLSYFLNELKMISGSTTLKNSEWMSKCRSWKKRYPTCLREFKNQSQLVNSYYLIEMLSSKMEENETIISDAGSAIDVVYHAFKVKKNQHVILSGGLASMGYAVPAAIGASIEQDKNTVIVTGDGSLQMNIQELATLNKTGRKIKIFVLNNKGYLTIRGAQNKHFNGRLMGESDLSGLAFPNLSKIAEAYDIAYYKLENHNGLNETIEEILHLDKVVLCEVLMDPNQLIEPKQSAITREDGKIQSRPLEDMFPFLDRESFFNEMITKPIE